MPPESTSNGFLAAISRSKVIFILKIVASLVFWAFLIYIFRDLPDDLPLIWSRFWKGLIGATCIIGGAGLFLIAAAAEKWNFVLRFVVAALGIYIASLPIQLAKHDREQRGYSLSE